MEYLILAVAILAMTLAHLVRTARWKLFIDIYEKPNTRNLIQSTSLGFIISNFVPFKLGDLFRAWFSGRKMKNGQALSFSTVIVDRYLDIVSVGFIFVALYVCGIGGDDIKLSARFYVLLTAGLLVATVLVYVFRNVIKKIVRVIASIFNKRIESFVLFLFWALIWNFSDIFKKISKLKMIVYTVVMWGLYVSSYFAFSEFLLTKTKKGSWTDVFLMFFTSNSITRSTIKVGQQTVFMALYIFVPLLLLLAVSLFFKRSQGKASSDEHINLLPQLNKEEKLQFLDSYFSNNNREYVDQYLAINRDISIIRDYSAGSNATTMLCMDDDKTFFRKYAFGKDGDKLFDQIQWIEKYKDILPLPEIIKDEKNDGYCYYDMPYYSSTVGFFEYIHSMPIEKSWDKLERAIQALEKSIYKVDVRDADHETIARYVEGKVDANLRKIKEAAVIKPLLKYKKIVINGVEYDNLPVLEKFLDTDYLAGIFENDKYSVIHGDMTIENIVCKQDDDDFYIIDPNTGNVHESPNLDYGKLLQSMHGGYEFLMATREVDVRTNRIDFVHINSSVYKQMYKRFHEYMMEKFGQDRVKSIYYHEVIHWLRLLPYKITKDGKRALLFYAGLIVVLNDVVKMFEED